MIGKDEAYQDLALFEELERVLRDFEDRTETQEGMVAVGECIERIREGQKEIENRFWGNWETDRDED